MSHLAGRQPDQPIAAAHALKRSGIRFNTAMLALVVTLFFLDLTLTRRLQLDGLSQLVSGWQAFLIVVGALCLCHWLPLPRLIRSCEHAIWAVLLFHLLSVVIQVAARSPCPLVDTQLAQIDRWLHLNTAGIKHGVGQLSMLQSLFAFTYSLAPWAILLALMLPPFLGHPKASRRFLIGLVIATFLTAILFAFWPAAGPWTTENFIPSADQIRVTQYLSLLKSRARVRLDFDSAAIVSFPSFHVVLAVLSATALGGIRWIKAAAWCFAALTCFSTLTTGWHYGIDLLGGVAVAFTAHLLAKWVSLYFDDAEQDGIDVAGSSTALEAHPERFTRAA